MSENEIARIVVNTCFRIHSGLGPGLFESVYEEILAYELEQQGVGVERQKIIPVVWKGLKLNQGFKADIILENKVLLDIKAVDALTPMHQKQVLTYLKISRLKLGLIINFNEVLIKNGIKRIIHNL